MSASVEYGLSETFSVAARKVVRNKFSRLILSPKKDSQPISDQRRERPSNNSDGDGRWGTE